MKIVFTYGSLMFPQVWDKIVRGHYKSAPAVLKNYQRKQVKNVEYPAIVARTSSLVSGVAYFGVSGLDLKLLDDFEGEIYLRKTVSVEIDAQKHDADVYVLKAKYRHLLGQRDWLPEDFTPRKMQAFLTRSIGVR